ncbi:late secretory pathway protein avl9-related [Anaeramoeba ignava]|uniref:Late secretory pathway protein avl9-related n=1 Tax=Anaeramoeba ignava TaxID=1746090 RepID=A0A9Q0R6K3_ANAIG|nr:late secretory pathway protein avl9-related [Anaeramoeba ignava]
MQNLKKPVHSISIAEFDISLGNNLTQRYPEFTFKDYDIKNLASLSIPDGGHSREEDLCYMILNLENEEEFKNEKEPFLYGLAYFKSIPSKETTRGAIQISILLLSYYPYFTLFLPFLRGGLDDYLKTKSINSLKTLHSSLNSMLFKKQSVKIWGQSFPVSLPILQDDEILGSSLIRLIKSFKEDVMIIWHAILLESRVIFVADQANIVGSSVISTPSLILPIKGLRKFLIPYFSLTDISPIKKNTFIAGTSNFILEEKTDLWDFLVSFKQGKVIQSHNNFSEIKLNSDDKVFIQEMIQKIEEESVDEKWVRNQFRKFTEIFLFSVKEKKFPSKKEEFVFDFCQTSLFKDYVWKQENSEEKSYPFRIENKKPVLDVRSIINQARTLVSPANSPKFDLSSNSRNQTKSIEENELEVENQVENPRIKNLEDQLKELQEQIEDLKNEAVKTENQHIFEIGLMKSLNKSLTTKVNQQKLKIEELTKENEELKKLNPKEDNNNNNNNNNNQEEKKEN